MRTQPQCFGSRSPDLVQHVEDTAEQSENKSRARRHGGRTMVLRSVLTLAGLVGWAAVSVPTAGAAAAARKPNVIVIVADDMGYADLGVNGCRDIPTPHIDSLAANG